MKLKEIAHARTGDKGEISNISVIPYDENNYEMLKEKSNRNTRSRILPRNLPRKSNPLRTGRNPCAELCPRQDTRRRCYKIAGVG